MEDTESRTVDSFAVMLKEKDLEVKHWLKLEVAQGVSEGRYRDGMTMSELVLTMLRAQREVMKKRK